MGWGALGQAMQAPGWAAGRADARRLLPLNPTHTLAPRAGAGQHGQWYDIRGPARAHDGRAAEPLVWPGRRGAGIGTPEAIRLVWSCHREIISDVGPVPAAATLATT